MNRAERGASVCRELNEKDTDRVLPVIRSELVRASVGERPVPLEVTAGSEPPSFAFMSVATGTFKALRNAEDRSKITTVIAPPGYGKTVLFTQLFHVYAAAGANVRWIGLSDQNNSVASVLRLLEREFDIDSSAQMLAEEFSISKNSERIFRMVDWLQGYGKPLLIFIDNIDFCTEPGIEEVLDAIVFQTPGNIRMFVSSSSSYINFNAGRARIELNLKEIGPKELAFDREETAELFLLSGNNCISTNVIDAIVAKTEGWPAAVRLFQLTADTGAFEDGDIELLPRDEKHLANILSHRLMNTFPENLIRFLLEISELRYFSRELAEVATSDKRSGDWIDFLIERNILIIPIDQHDEWFRFHTLFRRFLLGEAGKKVSAARRTEVGGGAARWLLRRGDLSGAFDLAIGVRDTDLVAILLEEGARVLVREQGDTHTFIDWVERAREFDVTLREQAVFWYVWALLFERRFTTAAEFLQSNKAIRETGETRTPSRGLKAKLGLAEILTALHLDSPIAVRLGADAWLAANVNAEPFHVSAAAGALACSCLANFDLAGAGPALRTSLAAIAQSNSIYGHCWAESVAALIDIHQGNPSITENRLVAVETRARAAFKASQGIVSVVSVMRARAVFEMGRQPEAKVIVLENLHSAVERGIPDTTWAAIEVILPFAALKKSSISVDDLRNIARKYPKRIGVLLDWSLVREFVQADLLEQAQELAADIGWNYKDMDLPISLQFASEMEKSTARVAIGLLHMAASHLQRAHELFQEELKLAQEMGRRGQQVLLNLLLADVHTRANARTRALRAFSRAVSTAARHEIFGPFLRCRSFVSNFADSVRAKELGLTTVEEFQALNKIMSLIGKENHHLGIGIDGDTLSDPLTPSRVMKFALG